MKAFHNFTLYTPEGDDLPGGVLFLQSDSGFDWYLAQKQFRDDTVKIAYDAAGNIRSAETDASGLWPVDCSVAEIAAAKVPEGFTPGGEWVFNGKAIVKYAPSKAELAGEAGREKTRLMAVATSAIAPLQNAVDLDMATETERADLLAWKKYSVLLNRVDVSGAPDISWPEVPGDVA